MGLLLCSLTGLLKRRQTSSHHPKGMLAHGSVSKSALKMGRLSILLCALALRLHAQVSYSSLGRVGDSVNGPMPGTTLVIPSLGLKGAGVSPNGVGIYNASVQRPDGAVVPALLVSDGTLVSVPFGQGVPLGDIPATVTANPIAYSFPPKINATGQWLAHWVLAGPGIAATNRDLILTGTANSVRVLVQNGTSSCPAQAAACP